MKNEFLQIEEAIVAMLKTVYDPEIPVNIYDLGLVYKVDVDDQNNVHIDMTLTAPNCPAADFILEDVIDQGGEQCGGQSGVRTGVEQGYDDRRGQIGTGLTLIAHGQDLFCFGCPFGSPVPQRPVGC